MLMQTPSELREQLIWASIKTNAQPWRNVGHRPGIAPAPRRGYEWRIIGEEKLVHVVQGRPVLVTSPVMTLVEKPTKKYDGARIRELDRERGCGNPRKVRR